MVSQGVFNITPLIDPKIKKDLPDFGGKFRGDSLREGIDPKAVHSPRFERLGRSLKDLYPQGMALDVGPYGVLMGFNGDSMAFNGI